MAGKKDQKAACTLHVAVMAHETSKYALTVFGMDDKRAHLRNLEY